MQNSTAILFFTRSIRNEYGHKSLGNSVNQSKTISKILIGSTLEIIQNSKIPYFISRDQDQNFSFGEKLSLATKTLFNSGVDKIIIVGNDCPNLSAKLLNETKEKLDNHDLVIGPDKRGGVYLLGISKSCFNEKEFNTFLWQSNQLVTSIKQFSLQNNLKSYELVSLHDINSRHELVKVLHILSGYHLLKNLIKGLILFQYKIYNSSSILYQKLLYSGMRAPPALS